MKPVLFSSYVDIHIACFFKLFNKTFWLNLVCSRGIGIPSPHSSTSRNCDFDYFFVLLPCVYQMFLEYDGTE